MSEWIIVTMILAFIAERVYKWTRVTPEQQNINLTREAERKTMSIKLSPFDTEIGDCFMIDGALGPMPQKRIAHDSIKKFFSEEDELFLFYSHAEICNRLYVKIGDIYYAHVFEVESLIFEAEKFAEIIKEKREDLTSPVRFSL